MPKMHRGLMGKVHGTCYGDVESWRRHRGVRLCESLAFFRERKLNTSFFFSSISGTSRISRQNPWISRQKSLVSVVSRDIPNFSAPTPSRGRPPPHPKISGPKSLGLGSFFLPDPFASRNNSFQDTQGLPQ